MSESSSPAASSRPPLDVPVQVEQISWAGLVPQAARGVLYLLHPDEDLQDVGEAIAHDEVPRVRALLESGRLYKPPDDALRNDPQRLYRFVIVQPFVVAQAEADPSAG